MAGTMTTLPNLLGFGGETQAKYFREGGAVLAGVTALTDFKALKPYASEHAVD